VPGPEWWRGQWDPPPCREPLVSPATDDELMLRTLEELERLNVVGVLSGPLPVVERWKAAAPDRLLIPGLMFSVKTGPSPEEFRELVRTGRVAVLGEVINQYDGIAPDDPRFEPYLAIAEELDIPVAIHLGPGPPGTAYVSTPEYRSRLGEPALLEQVLGRHPRLRVYAMHAGWPLVDEMIQLLYAHPQLYVDVGILTYAYPQMDFHRFLGRLVEAGMVDRILFGSDQMIWPDAIERAIEGIESADFLTAEQKRMILHDNAARFLRLDEVSTR
ncbi:MAG: amidohydrolase family protein, partial [Actinobacteria bacterium]|nr:amidohydrolase family protein [Actinomycetota bacterium]